MYTEDALVEDFAQIVVALINLTWPYILIVIALIYIGVKLYQKRQIKIVG